MQKHNQLSNFEKQSKIVKNNIVRIERISKTILIVAEVDLCKEIRKRTQLIVGRYFLEIITLLEMRCLTSNCNGISTVYEARIVSAKDKQDLEFGINKVNEQTRKLLCSTNGLVSYCLDCQLNFMMGGINLTGVTEMDIDSLRKNKKII